MKPIQYCIVLFSLLIIISCKNQEGFDFSQRELNFNENWKFIREDVNGAETSDFDDSNWRVLTLPHDYSIEDLPENLGVEQIGPFSKESPGKESTGHVLGGTAWYRKSFTLQKDDEGKKVQILFDGIYMNSDVWINGHHLGNRPYGYSAFHYNLTNYLNPVGEENILAVQVKNMGENSRWYSGSGIYRNVKLIKTNSIHVDIWGTFITTPEVSQEKSKVNIETTLQNSSSNNKEIIVQLEIKNKDGNIVANKEQSVSISGGQSKIIQTELELDKSELWDTDTPNLYTAETTLKQGNFILDKTTNKFGIRSIEFLPGEGFLLNGKNVLIKGGCLHHDNGILGSAAFNAAERRRVEIMKANGFNGIRCAHNPPSVAFLDACDEFGMLVMNESFDQWKVPKKPQDYNLYFDDWWERDTEAMMLRDRNHPSIIIWSVGNEIFGRGTDEGLKIYASLIDKVKMFDTTRPVTQAVCRFWRQEGKPWSDTEPIFEQTKVQGYNYQWARYEEDLKNFPERVIIGTESVAGEAFENWQAVKNNPAVIGDYSWTGMDYFGESGIGHNRMKSDGVISLPPWPWYNAYCGDISVLGYKKPQMYYRDVIWDNSDLEIVVHEPIPEGDSEVVSFWGWPNEWKNWNWEGSEGKAIQVNVYSNCDEVRLEINGKEIATKPVSNDTKLTAKFEFPYQPGELTAIGLIDGKEHTRQTLKSAGKAAQIRIIAEDKIVGNSQELRWFNIEVLDENGLLVPNATIPIEFEIEGDAKLQAVGNGNPSDMKSFQKPSVNTFRGKCQLIVRTNSNTEEIGVTAKSKGLKEGQCKISVQN